MDKIWHKNYDPGVPYTIDPDQYSSIPEMLEEAFKKYADSPCFINFGETLTFKQVDELSQTYAGFLQTECKLEKGDRVAIMMPNCLQYPVALFGALRAGMVNVNISPLYSSREINYALEVTGTKCIIVLANFAHLLEKALPRTHVRHVIVTHIGDLFPFPKRLLFNFVTMHIKRMVPSFFIPNSISFRDTIVPAYREKFKKTEIHSDDLACLQFTEGRETGTSKCAMLTHRNFVANGLQNSAWLNPVASVFKEKLLATLPPFFKLTALSLYVCAFMRNGMAIVLVTNPRDISVVVKEVKRYHPSVIVAVRTVFNDLLFNREFLDLDKSALQCTFAGGMVIPQALADRWQSVTHTLITQTYALTEGAPVVICNPVLAKKFNGSAGLPMPSTDIKICDEEGQELPIGSRGEIWLRGPQVMKGYWNQPEETKKVLTEEGWFKSGDIGYISEEGYVYLVDRKEDCIKTANGIVYPSEVENVITELGGIEDAVVIAARSPAKTLEFFIKAYIVKKDLSISEDAILAHCRRHLDNYEIPDQIEFCSELPRSATGFILRRLLREKNGQNE